MDSQSVEALESTLRQLQDAVKDLGNSSDLDELLLMIHPTTKVGRPPGTTSS